MSLGPVLAAPGEENNFQNAYIERVLASYFRITGNMPIVDGPAGQSVWSGDFALLTHRGGPEARLNYGNRFALDLWECNWDQFTATPSNATAPEEGRAAREEMMQRVMQNGFVTGYSGHRVTRTGRLFLIEDVTIWRLLDESGISFGVGAFFRQYRYL
ncbi:MAG: hypothetical protein RL274_1079 [Pseudomonadota bacterium]|jgi:hypothetical protein